MVNAYNPCILLHWQANMDIQMVDGPLGIAYYMQLCLQSRAHYFKKCFTTNPL